MFIKGANNEHETFTLKEFPFKQETENRVVNNQSINTKNTINE